MSDDPLDIGPDHGLREVWLFTLFVTSDESARWEPPRPGNDRDWPLVEALGAGPLDPSHVSVFESADLGRGGLRKFLTDAIGMDPDQVNADAGKLDMISGTVALVQARALTDRPGRFTPVRPVNFIGHYTEAQHLAPSTPHAPSESTRGHIPAPDAPAPDTRRPLLITLAALIVLVLVVLALF